MMIVIDKNIILGKEAFSTFGDVTAVSGKQIKPGLIKNADILVVRSITRVDESLIGSSTITFVGTVSSGVDHIDVEYLKDKGIGFSNAPGANANSVAEYVIACLLLLNQRGKISLGGTSLGVVGVGNIGSRVVKMAEGLGIMVFQNDPPLFRKSKDLVFRKLDEMMNCDVITLHVPLTCEGIDKTYQLFASERLKKMKKGTIIINTSRGEVVDQSALKSVLKTGHLSGAVLDVWTGEPDIDKELLELVDIGTPHVAGYSLDGRIRATRMIFDAVNEYFDMKKDWKVELPIPDVSYLDESIGETDDFDAMHSIVKKVYNIAEDDERTRGLLSLQGREKCEKFRFLRTTYPVRREFFNTKLKVKTDNPRIKERFRSIGFSVLD